jgi:hypothetical protein
MHELISMRERIGAKFQQLFKRLKIEKIFWYLDH